MASPYPSPIDPAYEPAVSITRLPADAPIDDILAVLDRDGGVILTDLVSTAELADIDDELDIHIKKQEAAKAAAAATATNGALHIIPPQTTTVPGLVGKSATVARICSESPVLESLRERILRETFTVIREDRVEEYTVDPLLSISLTFNIGYEAPRQKLHRDDNVHGTRHNGFELRKAGQFACLIAASRTTRENGATMFIPGSHRWDDKRVPRLDEICFAEMSPGSALIFLASCYHGGGHNSVPGSVRKVHGLFFVRGTMRTEENQFLAVPHSKVLTMSPKILSLLGYKKPDSVLGIVENMDPMAILPEALKMVAM